MPSVPLEALPVVLAYLAASAAFGIGAKQIGISLWATIAMSVFVYAGSAQMVALGLIGAGAPLITLVATTFLVNLRHLLMGAAIASKFSRWAKVRRALYAVQMTDETFAVLCAKRSDHADPKFAFRLNLCAHSAWVTGSVLGFQLGGAFNPSSIGLDYAMTGMLIAIWALQVSSRKVLLTSLGAAALTLIGVRIGLSAPVGMLVAAVVCPTLAIFYWRPNVQS